MATSCDADVPTPDEESTKIGVLSLLDLDINAYWQDNVSALAMLVDGLDSGHRWLIPASHATCSAFAGELGARTLSTPRQNRQLSYARPELRSGVVQRLRGLSATQ